MSFCKGNLLFTINCDGHIGKVGQNVGQDRTIFKKKIIFVDIFRGNFSFFFGNFGGFLVVFWTFVSRKVWHFWIFLGYVFGRFLLVLLLGFWCET